MNAIKIQKFSILQTTIIIISISSISFLISALLSYRFNLISAIVLVVSGVITYLIVSINQKSLLEVRALFSLVWMVGVGLSCLRINVNQTPWAYMTWASLALTYIFFILGYYFHGLLNKKKEKSSAFFIYKAEPRSLLNIIVVLFLVSLLSLVIEIVKFRYIPILSSDMNAYANFGMTGIHYFTVSCIFVPPLSYYYIQKLTPTKFTKAMLIVMSLVSAVIPLLLVSRQLYIMEIIVLLLVFIKVGNKNQFLAALLAVSLILIGFGAISVTRNQSKAYLENVFSANSSSDSVVSSSEGASSRDITKTSSSMPSSTIASSASVTQSAPSVSSATSSTEIHIPIYLYQPYMYIAYNYDNYNYMVENITEFSFGRQIFQPVTNLTGLKFVIPQYLAVKTYLKNPYLNAEPITYFPYYDFGLIGVVLYMLVVGFICSWITLNKQNNIFMLIFEALFSYSLIFSFFTDFFANTTMVFYFCILFVLNLALYKSSKGKTFK